MSELRFDEIEKMYDALAEAIDRAGPANEALFLTRLALLLGEQLGDSKVFQDCLSASANDLGEPPPAGRPALSG
jgi:hypothetical protein